jgi:nucleoside-diphosphate-sugar epimerase
MSKKRILIIGGSYFVGRVFCIKASRPDDAFPHDEYELHVLNRGKSPLNREGVTEYVCDRHDPRKAARLVPDLQFDALIDFCAYEPGDIREMFGAFGGRIKQYIYFSTASVYLPENGVHKREGAPVYKQSDGTPALDYVYKKLQLEQELTAACEAADIPYTILRPTFIYGPFNYAPRESYFIERIARKETVPVPTDAAGRWSFVYVIDIYRLLTRLIANKQAFNDVFNLAAPEIMDYTRLISDFERLNHGSFLSKDVTVKEVIDGNLPLPFPLDSDDLTDGRKLCDALDFTYTPFAEGIEKTFSIFYDLYTS